MLLRNDGQAYHDDIASIARLNQKDFIRTARILTATNGPLEEVLTRADQEFDIVTERIRTLGVSARVARHSFGLFRLDDREMQAPTGWHRLTYHSHPSIPAVFGLAAKVEVITKQRRTLTRREQGVAQMALSEYGRNAYEQDTLCWTEGKPDQFIPVGHLGKKALVLADIEPVVGFVNE